jgi:hypothetical protein
LIGPVELKVTNSHTRHNIRFNAVEAETSRKHNVESELGNARIKPPVEAVWRRLPSEASSTGGADVDTPTRKVGLKSDGAIHAALDPDSEPRIADVDGQTQNRVGSEISNGAAEVPIVESSGFPIVERSPRSD